MARGQRASDRLAADRAAARRRAGAARRKPSPARLRPRDRRELPHRRRARRGEGRTSIIEPHQSFDHQRLWADLLSSAALAFNLFGDLAADLGLADRAVHAWWPDAPGTVCEVRFEHSPGRFDPATSTASGAFDAAFVLDLGDGTQGIVGVDTKYHERAKPETPKPSNLPRYLEVAERSGVFEPGAIDAVKGRSDLAVMWLEHLLLLSMLQHASGSVELGPIRRRPPGRQLGLRRRVRPVPRATRGPVDLRLR